MTLHRTIIFGVGLFVLGLARESNAQSGTECDSTIFVSDTLHKMIDVRAELREWIPPNAGFHFLFEQPKARNRNDAARFMLRSYPPHLKERGIGGLVVLAILVDTVGIVKDRRVLTSSSYVDLDRAALETARMLRYNAFRLESGCAVRTVLHLPMVFQIR
jgi:TonB family protein